MKPLVTSLCISGFLCLTSVASGVSSFVTSNGGYTITYYHGYLLRGYVALLGGCLLYLAWLVFKRRMVAWCLIFVGQVVAWGNFVIAGTYLTAKQYPQESTRDTLLFGAMLAAVSSPVFIYWMLRWRKQRSYFESEPHDAA